MQRRSRFVVASFLGKCCQARAGATATKDEHEDNVVVVERLLLLLSWADFSSVWRATSTLTKQRRAPKFHPRQIQSTCKPDNIHPNAGEATHQNKFKVRITFLDICTNFTLYVKITKLPWKSKAFWDWKMQLLCLWYGLESLLERKHTILLIVLFPFTGKR